MSATYKPVTLNCSCWRHIINILLTELSRSVWENLYLGRVYRPHCVRSVLTTSVKILPYRPPARLIRAKYNIPCIILGPVRTTPEIFENAALCLRVRPTVHTNPSPKRSFSKRSSKRRNLKSKVCFLVRK